MEKILIKLACLFALALILALPITSCAYDNHNEHRVQITVKKAERVTDGESSQYLVFTESGDVYCVDDSVWRWTFDASDRYAKIEAGQTYDCAVIGWRCRFLSTYPNLLEVRGVGTADDD